MPDMYRSSSLQLRTRYGFHPKRAFCPTSTTTSAIKLLMCFKPRMNDELLNTLTRRAWIPFKSNS